MTARALTHLTELADSYDIILSDIWGVLHNGIAVYPHVRSALAKARRAGKIIILITNSPRPKNEVIRQLEDFGMPADSYDGIVTSGDVTRALIANAPKRIFHIGPERDLSLFEGLDCELTEEHDARAIVCTGFFETQRAETPEDYLPLLQKLRGRDLPFICANPDIIVHIGKREIWCAGALARLYAQLGGRTLIAGKPHAPIYEEALARAAAKCGLPSAAAIDRSRVLAVGDGLLTDVKGAEDQRLDCLFIAGGIHMRDCGSDSAVNPQKLAAFLKKQGYAPKFYMRELA